MEGLSKQDKLDLLAGRQKRYEEHRGTQIRALEYATKRLIDLIDGVGLYHKRDEFEQAAKNVIAGAEAAMAAWAAIDRIADERFEVFEQTGE